MAIVVNKNFYSKTGNIEYRMSKTMAKELLKTRKGDEFKMNPNDFLCKIVNETFGLLGYCTKVITY